MKKFIIASTILLASAAAANAGCGNSAINGTWSLQFIASTSASTYVISGGVINGPGLTNIPITQNPNSCRVSFTTGATLWSGRSENVKGTTQRPHHIMMTSNGGAPEMFIMHRR